MVGKTPQSAKSTSSIYISEFKASALPLLGGIIKDLKLTHNLSYHGW